MSTSVTPSVRCPRCTATVRAGSDWCSLCFADLRPAPEPVAVPEAPTATDPAPGVEPEPAVTAPAGAQQAAPTTAPRGKRRKAAPAEDEVEALAAQMMAQLAASESGNPLGAASGLVDSTGKRAFLMVGGGVVAMLLFFVVLAVLGALV